MQSGVEHDDCERQHETGVGVGEYLGIGTAVMTGEAFHHSVYDLGFPGQSKTPQKLSGK